MQMGFSKIISHEIQADGFTGIEIGGAYKLIFRQSQTFSVVLEIQEDLIQYIETSVQDGIFHLNPIGDRRMGFNRSPRLFINAPHLDSINLAGAINADVNLNADELNILLAGASKLTLSGSANVLKIKSAGASNIKAFEMIARDATVSVAGAGKAEIYASGTLHINIAGASKVTYDGEPHVTRDVAGFGRIKKRSN